MPLLSYSTCVVNQLHGTGHKDTSELVTWLVSHKVCGIKSTVSTSWSCECVTDSQKRKTRGRRTQEQREHETAQDVSVVFTWVLGEKNGRSGELLLFFCTKGSQAPYSASSTAAVGLSQGSVHLDTGITTQNTIQSYYSPHSFSYMLSFSTLAARKCKGSLSLMKVPPANELCIITMFVVNHVT